MATQPTTRLVRPARLKPDRSTQPLWRSETSRGHVRLKHHHHPTCLVPSENSPPTCPPQHMIKSDLRSMCDPPTPNSALPQRMSFPRYLREHTWIPYPPSRGPRHLGLRRAPSLGFVTNSEAGYSTALAGKQCRTSFIPSNESVDRLRGPFPFSMGKRTRATSHLSLSSNQVGRDNMCL